MTFKPHYLVVDGNGVCAYTFPRYHTECFSLEAAETFARRKATENPGAEFFVYTVSKSFKTEPDPLSVKVYR